MAALDIPELYQCVHCGLCLNSCPTYQLLHLEPESPRGRIHLVRAAAEGRIEPNERFADHLYLCLMCRACESACPSGVQYGRIAEAARALLGPPGAPLGQLLVRFSLQKLLPYPSRLKLLAGLLRFYQTSTVRPLVRRLLPRRMREIEALLPPIPKRFFLPPADPLPAIGVPRGRVSMLSGCVMSLIYGAVNEATLRVLQLNGCEVTIPKGQACCGALNLHNGETAIAKVMARRNIDAFLAARGDAVIVNAAGCGAAMKEYGHLLREDPDYKQKAERFVKLVRDASEFLTELGLTRPPGRMELTVTYQDPCHLAHGQRVRSQPRALLAAIPGLRLVEMSGSDRCCGSAGIYNLTHPETSQEILREKMKSIADTRAEAVVAPNPGCMLQLDYGARSYGPQVKVLHLMDLLDQSYKAPARDSGE
ncbi:MAG: 4Fe-4S dicluster domain-containing protein [Deltaproteobacteria bacterium]|nr:4Fe-4S dicluster domain-containing protein [Deltaproteobacteria bacterium]